ncbi:Receptor-like protein kinase 1, putative [Theobroma cacao]|uniref:Receptor-like serine/threonine-protein kinase n=1 Tax=Theobroma cacao TaxID=3641 RepID=A0A061EM27_THECC|nr:Receptor-like protein kinase 1, putative [Theobroma cacao]
MSAKIVLPWFLMFSVNFCGLHAQNSSTITLGSSITAGTNASWHSPSGDFAFGFYSISGGLYLVGVWFDKIPERTLVWSANRDSPAEAGSTIQLTAGQLLLTYSNGTQQSINSGGAPASLGLMQDDGNFVLRDVNSSTVWRSFSFPTDTLLPGQALLSLQALYSNAKGTTDYSTGDIRLQMQYDGNLVLSTYHFSEPGYWWTGTTDIGSTEKNASLVFNQTAFMYLVNSTGQIIFSLTRNIPNPVEDYYHRATIDDHGNFQQYVYHKRNGSRWTRVWRALEDPCLVTSLCGVNGMCTSVDNETISCGCIPGHTNLDPSDLNLGCRPETPVNYCIGPSMRNFTVEVIDNADFPSEDNGELAKIENVDLEGCKNAVMEDCYTLAASLEFSTCYKKRMPLLKARKSASSIGIKALIKVPMKLTNADAIGVGFREFTFQELYRATNGFSKILGRGSSAKVYRGLLSLKGAHIEIAVKKLEKETGKSQNEFMTELKIIGRTHHKNLVRLVGFCVENDQQLLVYELMANGPLSRSLFGEEDKRPSWFQRAEMALGIARGLLYLHEECETQIIHCDIKPQNVLLDENYTAKIADFGLSKLLNKDQTRTDTNVRGTMGYLAPEWLKHAPITAKVDVFSYGVMLLEIICCRRHIEVSRVEEESEVDDLLLSEWIISCIVSGKLEMVVGHDADVLSDFKRFERMAMVGLWCICPDPTLRPSMKKVVQMLEGTMEVGVPPLLHYHQL